MAQKKEISLTQKASRLAKEIQKVQATTQEQIKLLEAERQQCINRIEPNEQVIAAKERVEKMLAEWSTRLGVKNLPQVPEVTSPIHPQRVAPASPPSAAAPISMPAPIPSQKQASPPTDPNMRDDDWLSSPITPVANITADHTADWLATTPLPTEQNTAQNTAQTGTSPDDDWLAGPSPKPNTPDDDWLSELDSPPTAPKNNFW